jgi:GTPase involved in cell partitioning and DNA repair
MEENCEKDFIEKFLNNLMDKNRHDICHRILKIYNYIELYKDLIISSEIKILLNKCDILNKIKALEKINELDDKISFCISFILESKNFENKFSFIRTVYFKKEV